MHVIDYVHKKQTGGAGQYAHVKLRITESSPGTGVVFRSLTTNDRIPDSYVPGVERGVKHIAESRDLVVELLEGSFHDIDSSVLSFELAARYAMEKAFQEMGIT